jgi:hypothetical protein
MALVRAVERETGLDRGGRFEVLTSPNIAEAAEAGLAMLIERVGSRVTLRIDPKQVGFEIFPR